MKFKNESILLAPSDERIKWFEESYRVILPEEYKNLLRTYNGAVLETNIFESDGREYLIERFLCLLDKPKEDSINGWYDLSVVITQLDARLIDDEDLIGMNVIPIATLFAGDFVCLDYRESEIPTVVVWFHEESDDFNPATVKVANNMNQFLDMLKQ